MSVIPERMMRGLAALGVAGALVFVGAFYFLLTAAAVSLGYYFLRIAGVIAS